VTSSDAGEGKTVTAANLAAALAQAGRRVVLLDCDMRKPRAHKVLGLDARAGMSTYLSGNCVLEEAVQGTGVPGLDAVAAGPLPPNPAELLLSGRMGEALERLSGEYEHVVVDSPPLLAVADARVLAPQVDGAVLVVRWGETPRGRVLEARRLLEGVRCRVLGAVLNGADMREAGYGGYARYYGYGEGEGHADGGDGR